MQRRTFLSSIIKSLMGGITAVLGVVLGGSVLSPLFARRSQRWIPAGVLADLEEGVPSPATVRLVRQDGYAEVVDRQVVFLIRSGATVRALASTCTHLGCRVSFDPSEGRIKCPCHGGVFDLQGRVLAGPPPQPLATVAARIDGDKILVQL